MTENVIEDYPDGCQIIHEERMYPDLYHVEQGSQRLKSFKNLDKARLYAEIYEVLGGFREKGTGKRGVPPTVARAGEDVRMAYFTASMSVTYAARAFEIEVERALEKVLQVREQAEQQRSQEVDKE
jgi:hypothetical protein